MYCESSRASISVPSVEWSIGIVRREDGVIESNTTHDGVISVKTLHDVPSLSWSSVQLYG